MKKCLALCEGRHEMPDCVEGSIFGNELNPTDLASMRATASEKLKDVDTLDLYVTGLTVALGEVIRLCTEREINLTLWHFDRNTGEYYPQTILRYNCSFCGTRFLHTWYCPECGAI